MTELRHTDCTCCEQAALVVAERDKLIAQLRGVDITKTVHPHEPRPSISLFTEEGVPKTMAEIEAEVIRATLEYYGSLSSAARSLGIGRATLYRKLKEYNIPSPLAERKALPADLARLGYADVSKL